MFFPCFFSVLTNININIWFCWCCHLVHTESNWEAKKGIGVKSEKLWIKDMPNLFAVGIYKLASLKRFFYWKSSKAQGNLIIRSVLNNLINSRKLCFSTNVRWAVCFLIFTVVTFILKVFIYLHCQSKDTKPNKMIQNSN